MGHSLSPFLNAFLISGLIHAPLMISIDLLTHHSALSEKRVVPIVGILVKRGQPQGEKGVQREKKRMVASPRKRREQPNVLKTLQTVEKGSAIGNSDEGATEGTAGDPNGRSSSLKELYLSEFQTFLSNHSKENYPPLSIKRGEEGAVEISCIVKKDGSISDIKIVTPSVFQRLNKATLAFLEQLRKFKAFPEDISEEELVFTQKIVYELI